MERTGDGGASLEVDVPPQQTTRASVPRAAFSVKEVATSLGVTERFVYDLIATQQINSFKLGGRRLVSAAELERLSQS